MALSHYKKKRDFSKTPEPSGEGGDRGRDGAPRFVIQKHAARTTHYDLRLEIDGVLKSWAVPKGPSTDPSEKRLAIRTEDHPLDYAAFEGAIPADQYGGGTVVVWDAGTYRNITEKDGEILSASRALAGGHLLVWLDGEKLRGGYALQRTGGGDDGRWLLVKMKDDAADARRNPVGAQPESVLTGRTVDEVAEQEDAARQ